VVDLPTPPLPEATAITERMPGSPGLASAGCRPGDQITADHPIMQWRSWNFLTTFLDSPTFLHR